MRTALVLAAALLTPLYAQQRDVFKLDLTIRDTADAAAKGGRRFSLLVFGQDKGTLRIGNRVPVPSGSPGLGGPQSYTYVDVGVNLDCTLQEVGGKVGMRADLDISTAIGSEKAPGAAPTISQVKVNISTAVVAGKPTVVASFDDPVTSRKFEVEALVTKMN